ncbi:MAG: thiamine pyrophosphate-dependent enzyme, partial [Ignavibacteriaceae bacterium]|nr:thiamine pyrophosphate-dependent enzyme [Ignavibacteriaceae bacterium]
MAKNITSTQAKSKDKTSVKPTNGKNDFIKIGKKDFDKDKLLYVLKTMLRSRSVNNKAMNLLRQGKTFFHISSSGHEAIQLAIGLSLDSKKDWLFPYYRDMAAVITAGISIEEVFLGSFAKTDDPSSGGRQMPTHWGARSFNMPAQSSPTGTQFLQAVGAAMSIAKRGEKNVAYVSSGEGTTSQGEFHEAVNWASREKLPVLFVIQNNKYAISVKVSDQSGGKDNSIAEMMSGYNNLYRARIDGTEFITSYEKVQEAIEYIKSGKGPALIEADVVRLDSHSSSDDHKKYRDKKELEEDLKRCPIEKFAKILISKNFLTQDDYEKLKQNITDEINDAADKAILAADPKPSDAVTFVFDESGFKETLDYESSTPSGDKIVMVDAINHALHEEMQRNPDMYIFGEDIE